MPWPLFKKKIYNWVWVENALSIILNIEPWTFIIFLIVFGKYILISTTDDQAQR